VWIDSSGKAAPLIPKPDVYLTPRLSPDGRSLAIAISSSDLHVWDIPRQTLTRVAFNQQNNLHPVWTADSRYIVYTSESNGVFAIWWVRADGASEPHKQLEAKTILVASSISPDGRLLAYYQPSLGTANEYLDPSARPERSRESETGSTGALSP